MSDYCEMYENLKQKQTLEILSLLAKEGVSEGSVRVEGDYFVFVHHELQVYLENNVTHVRCKMHRLPRNDQDKGCVKENLPLILSKDGGPPENFCKDFGYMKSDEIYGELEKTIHEALEVTRT